MRFTIDPKWIPTPLHGNRKFPLPPDYDSLSLENKRKARINAVCQQRSPEDFVLTWAWFRYYYLRYLPLGIWYQEPYYPSPPMHYTFVHDIQAHAKNAMGFPRAFAKSTLIEEIIFLWMISRPTFSVLLLKSIEDFVQATFLRLQDQLVTNERILEDFGELKPKRGEAGKMWNLGRMTLTNRFTLIGRSIKSKLPGLRPRYIFGDDVEFDQQTLGGFNPEFTELFKTVFFSHLQPMLEQGAGCTLAGTLYNAKLFLNWLVSTKEEEDPRVAFWNRNLLGAVDNDGNLLWEEKWNEETLDKLRLSYGEESYAANMLNRPGTSQGALLDLHPVLGYYQQTEDKQYLISWRKTGKGDEVEEVQRPWEEVHKNLFRVLVADPIRKPSSSSDYACCLVVGIENSPGFKDIWWVLDISLGRVKETEFFEQLWHLSEKWKVHVIGIESVAMQGKLTERMRDRFAERSDIHCTRLVKITYETGENKQEVPSKASRISGLAWRFDRHGIRLPSQECSRGAFRALKDQITLATSDLKLLQYDDAVDTLAMVPYLLRKVRPMLDREKFVEETDPIKKLEKGIYKTKSGLEILSGLNASELTPQAEAMLDRRRQRMEEATQRGKRRITMTKHRRMTKWKASCLP